MQEGAAHAISKYLVALTRAVPVMTFGCSLLVTDRANCTGSADTSKRLLRCGGSHFTVTNTYAPDAFIAGQTIDVRRKDGRVFHVDLRNLRKGTAIGIFGSVSSWLCHRCRHREFVELLYGCNSYMADADVDRYCRGENSAEWVRYIGLSGEPLDSG